MDIVFTSFAFQIHLQQPEPWANLEGEKTSHALNFPEQKKLETEITVGI